MIQEFHNFNELRTKRECSTVTSEMDSSSAFQNDYARLIHSPSFRRLQGKSQVFGAGSGDYYRTRLTHTLEVAQISRQIAERLANDENIKVLPNNPGLKIDPLVVECAALAHDLGHPPFGHKGEEDLDTFLKAINENKYKHMQPDLRYEGNAQNFRILMNLEERFVECRGLNLTHAVLLGINKYPYAIKENGLKGLYDEEWKVIKEIRESWGMPEGRATLEAQLMDISDDIAYSTHDIEDGMKAKKIILDESYLLKNSLLKEALIEQVENAKEIEPQYWEGINVIEEEIDKVLTSYLITWRNLIDKFNNESIARQELKFYYVNLFASRVGVIKNQNWYKVSFLTEEKREDKALWRTMIILKKLAWVTLVEDIRVQRLQKRGEIILENLWKVFSDEKKAPKIIPKQWMKEYKENKEDIIWERFIADYISGMTDTYAEKLYEELFSSRVGNIYGE